MELKQQEAVQIDGDVLVALLRKVSPSVHRHLVITVT